MNSLDKEYTNLSGLKFKIVRLTENKKCLVRFAETGSERECLVANAKAGKVKDLYSVSTKTGGCLGNANNYLRKERVLWTNMLFRVKDNPFYADVTVCDRWLCFENFLQDIRTMENYDLWLDGGYELDKDSKYAGNKVYSKQNCAFISRFENQSIKEKPITGNVYKATHDDGTVVTFVNQRKFCAEYGLCYKNLNRSIKKGGKTKGWTVIIETD